MSLAEYHVGQGLWVAEGQQECLAQIIEKVCCGVLGPAPETSPQCPLHLPAQENRSIYWPPSNLYLSLGELPLTPET